MTRRCVHENLKEVRNLANRRRVFSRKGDNACKLCNIWGACLVCSTQSKEVSVARVKGEEEQLGQRTSGKTFLGFVGGLVFREPLDDLW